MNCVITQPNVAWKQASTMFKRRGNDACITVFTQEDCHWVDALTKLLTSMLLGTGIILSQPVMPLGDKKIVMKECQKSSIPENKIYIINDKTNYGIHNLYAIQHLENLQEGTSEWIYLQNIIMVKDYLRKNIDDYLINELEYFRENFQRGWNGEDSMPLDAKVYANIYQITLKFNKLLTNWSLVLRTNGTVSLMSDDDRASIDVAREHISFYVSTRENKQLFQRHLKFELSTIEKILELWQLTA
jgi:hypothetical protein